MGTGSGKVLPRRNLLNQETGRIIGILLTWSSTPQCLSRREKEKPTFIISPSSEPLALMYYHKDVLKVIHYDESDILSLISSSVFLSFHFTSLYSIKKTHGTRMLKMKKNMFSKTMRDKKT